MISINTLTVAYGGFTLLNEINFHISESDKIGLVGKNGAGKSTILKLVCGLQSPTSGKVAVPNGVKIGYLPQIMEHHKGRSVIDEAMTAFADMFALEDELERISLELAQREDYESKEYHDLIVKMNEVNDAISYNRSDNPQVQAEKTLIGLGFKYEELSRPTETFSQGWNMRIELAKILLSKPDVLLLDEPTNHLDIESIEWLEGYLKDYRGSLVLISHDRKFLDNVTNRTVEIMLGRIHDYKVPYSKYLELRRERLEQQRAAFENQQRMIEKTEEFINTYLDEKDSIYISPNLYNFTIMPQYSNAYEYYRFSTGNGQQRITMSPSSINRIGLYLGWRWLFLGYSIDLEEGSPQTDINFSFYTSKAGIDLFYRKRTEGYMIRNLEGFKEGGREIVDYNHSFDGLTVEQMGLNLYYVFNNKKFSYPAAYSQSTNQRISAGSFILGVNYNEQSFAFDQIL